MHGKEDRIRSQDRMDRDRGKVVKGIHKDKASRAGENNSNSSPDTHRNARKTRSDRRRAPKQRESVHHSSEAVLRRSNLIRRLSILAGARESPNEHRFSMERKRLLHPRAPTSRTVPSRLARKRLWKTMQA